MNRLSINQQTVKQLSLPALVEACRKAGISSVGLWREPVAAYGLDQAAALMRNEGIAVTSLCRGGFFTAADRDVREAALVDNRAAIDAAHTLGTDTLVLVCGGLPEGSMDLAGARERVVEALGVLAPYAGERGVRLAIEALHPMFASDRCVVSTLAQSLEIASHFPAEQAGVVVDAYHLWWDPLLADGISAAGAAGRIASFQLADWITPLPAGVLVGRGQLGDGCIDLRSLRIAVEAAGYQGPIEVEIFNEDLWARDGFEVVAEIADRFRQHVL